MASRPIQTVVRSIFALIGLLISARAAAADSPLPFGIHFDTPSIYCEIAAASPAESKLLADVRRNSEPNMVLVGLFADCDQYRSWQGDPAKQPSRFGAAFLHKSSDGLKPVTEARSEYLKRLEKILRSWDQSSPKLLLEQIVKGAIDAKPQRVQIMAVMPDAIYIGFILEMNAADGSAKTMAGISAISLIKQVPVSLHIYRNRDNEGTVGALLPESMLLMRQWLASNEGANSAALSADARRNPTPDKGHRILPVPVRPRIAVRDPEQLEELLSHLKPATNPEREKIMTLLQSGQFEFLSRLVSEKQAAFDKGKLSEAQLLNTYFTFLSSAPDLRAKFDAWIHAQPTSYVPRVARGLYNTRLGWVARGTAYAQETASERFALMRTHFEAAIRDFDAALTRNPKLSVAWQNLVGISLAEGQPITDNLYNRGIEQVPSSVELRRAYASFFHPNWGSGLSLPLESFNATLAERNARWLKFYKALQADSAAVPALKPVVTSAQYRAAKHSFLNKDFTAASRRLVDAFTAGDESLALAALGRRQMAKRDYQAAVRSFDQALREGPRWNDNLRSRAKALGRLAHATRNFEAYKFALADYQSALELAPFDPDLLSEAASMVAGLPATFPDRAEQALEEMWKNPVSCQPHVEAPKKFTVIHTVPPDTLPVKIYCVAQWLFDKALVYGKSDPDIREARGRFYLFAMKFPSLAVKEYEAIIELNADQASTWERYALALHEIGDCRAIAAYQQHIARCKDGGCPTHVANMSRIHLSQLSLSSDCGG